MEKITILNFKTMEGTTSNMTINGVPINNKVMLEVVYCGNCESVLAQFEPNTPIRYRYDYIKNNLQPQLNYCPKCGSRIDYSSCEILDIKVEEVKEETQQ